jgi:hypothetical protein
MIRKPYFTVAVRSPTYTSFIHYNSPLGPPIIYHLYIAFGYQCALPNIDLYIVYTNKLPPGLLLYITYTLRLVINAPFQILVYTLLIHFIARPIIHHLYIAPSYQRALPNINLCIIYTLVYSPQASSHYTSLIRRA